MYQLSTTKAIKPTEKKVTVKMPADLELITNVNRHAEEKDMDKFNIKFWWRNSTNGKPTYVLRGQDLFKTLVLAGKTPSTVLAAMIAKYNEQIPNTLKIELYDNSIYNQVTKVLIFNGIETTIHNDYKHILHSPNTVHVGFRPNIQR